MKNNNFKQSTSIEQTVLNEVRFVCTELYFCVRILFVLLFYRKILTTANKRTKKKGAIRDEDKTVLLKLMYNYKMYGDENRRWLTPGQIVLHDYFYKHLLRTTRGIILAGNNEPWWFKLINVRIKIDKFTIKLKYKITYYFKLSTYKVKQWFYITKAFIKHPRLLLNLIRTLYGKTKQLFVKQKKETTGQLSANEFVWRERTHMVSDVRLQAICDKMNEFNKKTRARYVETTNLMNKRGVTKKTFKFGNSLFSTMSCLLIECDDLKKKYPSLKKEIAVFEEDIVDRKKALNKHWEETIRKHFKSVNTNKQN